MISGKLPQRFRSTQLSKINISRNYISGTISYFSSSQLQSIDLSYNLLSGPLLYNDSSICQLPNRLEVLDLGGNELDGNIPIDWGNQLKMLRLRGNQLVGAIPPTLCSCFYLTFIDLSHNYLTGDIPRCLGNLTGMRSSIFPYYSDEYASVSGDVISQPAYDDPRTDATSVVLKGEELQYTTTLKFVVNLDLSCNALVGSIPEEIIDLSALIGLNLSHNHLTGHIPNKIGEMRALESFDLSNNNLSGTIPSSMSDLTLLISLNLSYNNLHGKVPTGHQLQVIDNPVMAYIGNPELCGDPLPKMCNGHGNILLQPKVEKEYKKEELWKQPLFYSVIMCGFATGFWGVVGSLLLNKRFRFALFQLVGNVTDYLYVQVMIRLNKHRN